MCKQIITPYGEFPRNCRAKEYADGWCRVHHPDAVEENLIRHLQHHQRMAEIDENTDVGEWVREKYPALFQNMRDEINQAIGNQ